MEKAQVLARSCEGNTRIAYQLVINGLLEDEITSYEGNQINAAKRIADTIDLHGVDVGEYRELNGKHTFSQCRDIFDCPKISCQKMYEFHWLLLNEMLKLSKPKNLEARAA